MNKAILPEPQCEHRVTALETTVETHIRHVEERLKLIQRTLLIILGALSTGIVGVIIILIERSMGK